MLFSLAFSRPSPFKESFIKRLNCLVIQFTFRCIALFTKHGVKQQIQKMHSVLHYNLEYSVIRGNYVQKHIHIMQLANNVLI